jgi:steroid delta-isomerase-like uncharacterized protein
MTTQTSVQEIVQKQLDVWNSHNAAAVAAGYTPSASVLDPSYDAPLSGRAAIEKDAADFFVALPDLRFRVDAMMREGDLVAYEGSARGTHTGPLQLPTGVVPATNKPIEFRFAIFQRLDASGSIRDEHRYYDVAGMLGQLGLMQ